MGKSFVAVMATLIVMATASQAVAQTTARIDTKTRSINHTLILNDGTFGREEISAADLRMFKLVRPGQCRFR